MATTRKIDIVSDGHNFTLSDAATQAHIYTVILQWSSIPQIVIYAASDSYDKVSSGTVTFHQRSASIELDINGRSFFLRKHVFWSLGRVLDSAHNGILSWEKDGLLGHGRKLVDTQGKVVAKFESKGKQLGASKEDWGQFELVENMGGEALVEVVLSGMAMTLMQGSPNVALLNAPLGMTSF